MPISFGTSLTHRVGVALLEVSPADEAAASAAAASAAAIASALKAEEEAQKVCDIATNELRNSARELSALEAQPYSATIVQTSVIANAPTSVEESVLEAQIAAAKKTKDSAQRKLIVALKSLNAAIVKRVAAGAPAPTQMLTSEGLAKLIK